MGVGGGGMWGVCSGVCEVCGVGCLIEGANIS